MTRIIPVLLSLLFFIITPSSFAYIFPVRYNTSEPLLTTSDVGRTLAFEIFKASLTKNSISFTFPQYGLGSSFTINGVSNLGDGYTGNFSSTDFTAWVVLWPRTLLDASGACLCDYTVFGTFHQYYAQAPTNPSTNAYYFYTYFDSGVVSVVNYLGSFYNTPWENKSVTIDNNTTCSMPFDYSSTNLVVYFARMMRLLNLTQSGTRTDISSFGFGSIAELFSYQFRYAFLQGCGPSSVYNGHSKWFDLRSLQEINQSVLPWQLQIYNPAFDTTAHTKPNENFSADTDAGTEPDISEYYTGHNYLNDPSDDWGQPAEIGAGSSSGSGEVSSFGPQAYGQLTDGVEEGLENYWGSSVSLDPPDLETTLPSEDRDDPTLNDYMLSDSIQATSEILPTGVSRFQTLVNRLKTPDVSTIQPITISLECDFDSVGLGTVWENETVDIDFNLLLDDYGNEIRLARTLCVLVMYVSVIIYLIKDNFLLGNNGAE